MVTSSGRSRRLKISRLSIPIVHSSHSSNTGYPWNTHNDAPLKKYTINQFDNNFDHVRSKWFLSQEQQHHMHREVMGNRKSN